MANQGNVSNANRPENVSLEEMLEHVHPDDPTVICTSLRHIFEAVVYHDEFTAAILEDPHDHNTRADDYACIHEEYRNALHGTEPDKTKIAEFTDGEEVEFFDDFFDPIIEVLDDMRDTFARMSGHDSYDVEAILESQHSEPELRTDEEHDHEFDVLGMVILTDKGTIFASGVQTGAGDLFYIKAGRTHRADAYRDQGITFNING